MEKLWERLQVKELMLNETQTFSVGDLFHYKGTELYRADKEVAIHTQRELTEHISSGSVIQLHYYQWEKDKWYHKGDIVYIENYANLYRCIKSCRLPFFSEYELAPSNPANPTIETGTSANFNFGVYAQCHGSKASLAKVPKHNALMYVADDEPGVVYIYIKANDNLSTREHFGWTPIKGVTDGILTHKPILVDNITITGDGINTPLKASCSIPDYDEQEEYHKGRVVHATFNNVEGIYRAASNLEVIWKKEVVKLLQMNKTNLVTAGEFFEIRGLIDQQYNGFYKVNMADGALSMMLRSDNITDFLDHLSHNRFYRIKEWQPNTQYLKGMEVYNGNNVYTCMRKNMQAVFKPLDDIIYWQLLADISIGSKDRMPIGAMMMFVGNKVPAGWLLCNGQRVNKSSIDAHGIQQEGYPLLYNVLGGKYGEDDYKFSLPIADNMIIRAV